MGDETGGCAAFERRLVPAAEAYRPQFVLISAGFDAHAADPLADLHVTEEGFAQMTRIVKRHAGGRTRSPILSVEASHLS